MSLQWPKLVGKARRQPPTGNWHDWKQAVADACEGRCIYCAISESRYGGIRNFHIEHFRPKARFQSHENIIANLYLACSICNVLKCDDWPGDPKPDHSVASYPDPSVSDYNTLFATNGIFELSSSFAAGRYVIERVLLNRAQLVVERRLWTALSRLEEFNKWVQASVNSMGPAERKKIIKMLANMSSLQLSALRARPYNDADTKRPAKTKAKRRRLSS